MGKEEGMLRICCENVANIMRVVVSCVVLLEMAMLAMLATDQWLTPEQLTAHHSVPWPVSLRVPGQQHIVSDHHQQQILSDPLQLGNQTQTESEKSWVMWREIKT